MKKIVLLSFLVAGMSAFAEMALVPINQLIKRGKSNAMLVARNAKMADITRVAGYMAGRQMGENAPIAPVYAEGYFPTYRNDKNNTGLGFELQAWSSYLQKTVSANIFFYEEDNNLYAYLYQFKLPVMVWQNPVRILRKKQMVRISMERVLMSNRRHRLTETARILACTGLGSGLPDGIA